jgi:hypothetical protein
MVVSLESLKRLRTRHSKVSLLPLLLTSLRKTTTTQNQSKLTASAVLHERSGLMKRSTFSEEQVVYAIRQFQSRAIEE